MLQLSKAFINVPVMSLRTGGAVGTAVSPIINPNNLKIEGFYCNDRFSKDNLILLSQEIRDIIAEGIVVNDHEAMSEPGELIRLKKVMDLKFELINKVVETTGKRKLGKINDFAVDSGSLYIQKLYVSQSLVKNFKGGQLSIDRSQIVEITHRRIVVQDPVIPVESQAQAPVPIQV